MLRLFRGAGEPPHRTPLSMIGARPGDSVLFVGAGRPDLAGAVGAVTGLNGQTTVVDRQDGAAKRVAAGAAASGALVDYEDAPLTMLPFDNGSWDAAVLASGLAVLGGTAAAVLSEAVRVVRPGGRVVVIEAVSRPGLFGLFRTPLESVQPPETTTGTLAAAGLRGVRLLAEVEGVRYFEGTKPHGAPVS
jgi:ubiquinone/menaquinone biosynthesis C-methylase UbiE